MKGILKKDYYYFRNIFSNSTLEDEKDYLLGFMKLAHGYGKGWPRVGSFKKIHGKNKLLIMTAVRNNGFSLFYASKELKDEKKVVLTAVRKQGCALRYASKRLRDDREVVLAAVKNDGWALCFASTQFQKDKEVVLTAIRNNAFALDHASKRLKDDREVVKLACKRSGRSLYLSSRKLRSDKEFIKELKISDLDVFECCHCSIRKHKDIYLPALKKDPTLCKRFSLNVLLKLDFTSLPKKNQEVIYKDYKKRTKEKDIFRLAKAKKDIVG